MNKYLEKVAVNLSKLETAIEKIHSKGNEKLLNKSKVFNKATLAERYRPHTIGTKHDLKDIRKGRLEDALEEKVMEVINKGASSSTNRHLGKLLNIKHTISSRL